MFPLSVAYERVPFFNKGHSEEQVTCGLDIQKIGNNGFLISLIRDLWLYNHDKISLNI